VYDEVGILQWMIMQMFPLYSVLQKFLNVFFPSSPPGNMHRVIYIYIYICMYIVTYLFTGIVIVLLIYYWFT
jgi:hypothetical protein